jgi:hypothetical protein
MALPIAFEPPTQVRAFFRCSMCKGKPPVGRGWAEVFAHFEDKHPSNVAELTTWMIAKGKPKQVKK